MITGLDGIESELPVCPGDLVILRQVDHLAADRPVQLRVVEVWPAPEWRTWVLISGVEIKPGDADRDGKTVNVQAYRDALDRPGAVYRRGQTSVCPWCLAPATLILECSAEGDKPACATHGLNPPKGCTKRPDGLGCTVRPLGSTPAPATVRQKPHGPT